MAKFKKWFSVAMIFIMLFSLITPAANVQASTDDANIEGYVYFEMEDFAKRLDDSAVSEQLGTIVKRQEIPFYSGETIADVTVRALEANNITPVYTGEISDGFYLSSIEDFTLNGKDYEHFGERSTSDFSGWMITLNDWLINRGASDFLVSKGDTISWQYSTEMGADIGGDWNTSTPAIKGIELLNSEGQLSPAFDENVKQYELIVPSTSTTVQLYATDNKYNLVQYFVGNQEYKYLHDIPVSNGTEITITSTNQDTSETDEITLTVVVPNVSITVPKDATLAVGKKTKHFIAFEQLQPVFNTTNSNNSKTYYYNLTNKQTFNYRVSQPGKLTNVGTFVAGNNLEITEAQLNAVSPKAILNKGTHLEGNIYLNINTQNHLSLKAGESFNLLPLRSWQALIEGIQNYFFEPDFHYEIITGQDVIAIEPGVPGSYAKVNALKDGTAIVKVTYDALKVNGSTYVKDPNDAFSAIWPENVGLFVVTVDENTPTIKTGIESNKSRNENNATNLQKGAFDADIDSVYYKQGERGAYYTFTPEENSTVTVLRPTINKELSTASYGDGSFTADDVQKHDDGSYTILLTEGRNIVKVEKDGQAAYQVMTARPLQITISNLSNPNAPVQAGDEVSVKFDGLSFPANKLSGIYNFKAQLTFKNNFDEKLTAASMQYDITTKANTIKLTIPKDHEGDYILQDGHIVVSGFGSEIGAHRGIDPLVGASPNFSAGSMNSAFSIFPSISIIDSKADTAALQQALLNADNSKVNVAISIDGKDIEPTATWVTQQQVDALNVAILEAQQLLADEAATQQAIDAKTLALNQSIKTFTEAKKAGLKQLQPLTVDKAYNDASAHLLAKNKNPEFGSEWVILALARGGYKVPADYFETYYNNVVAHVQSVKGELHSVKYTEYSRLILALTAIGKDPTNVGGYDLVAKLGDFDKVIWQGINGSIFGLIALDTWNFNLAADATTTREKLIDNILSLQLADGGFALFGTKADPDITGMAIQALAPHVSKTEVKTAVDKALATLANIQNENGGYGKASESVAQVITALTALEIDPIQDDRFSKTINNLLSFYSDVDGGFKHLLSEQIANGMATEQAAYTLASYKRLLNKQSTLYDMSDTKLANPSPSEPSENTGGTDNGSVTPPSTGGGGQTTPPTNGDSAQPTAPQQYGKATISITSSKTDIPLAATTVEIFENESVFDVLKRVTSEKGISLNSRTTGYGVYVEGINGLFEFDKGPESGWMYRVNGVFPSHSAALQTVKPNDKIEWLYTINLGKDIGGYVEEAVTTPGTSGSNTNSGSAGGSSSGGGSSTPTPTVPDEKPEITDEDNKENTSDNDLNNGQQEDKTEEENSQQPSPVASNSISAEQINEQLEQNAQQITVQGAHNSVVTFEAATLSNLQLQAGEKVISTINVDQENQLIDVVIEVEKANGSSTALVTQKEYVSVTLPLENLTNNTVILQSVNGEYKAVPHKIVDGKAVILTKSSGTFVVMEFHKTFKDIEKIFNKDEIEFLASRHVIKGVNEEQFMPNKAITRGQFAVMISRALGLQATNNTKFTDIKGRWYEQEIQALYEAGITTGRTASSFDPEAVITRQQAAAFMARILEYVNYEAAQVDAASFKDAAAIQKQFQQYVNLLNSLNIMTGKEDGSFDPNSSLSRAQMAKILKRTLNVAELM